MRRILLAFVLAIFSFLILPNLSSAAVILVGPTTGTFTVGSTFNVSIFLDTQGASINAIDISLLFPPDKLQLVSPEVGKSVIGVWTSQPRFNNQAGTIELQGGIPGGINVSRGLVSNFTFRVKAVGQAILKFMDGTKILLNDGLGTNVLFQSQNAVYDLVLPPPGGPIVASETHFDQSTWYSNQTAILKWAAGSDVDGYSYILNQNPVDIPDDISEGIRTSVAYQNLSDGLRYFHIKALRNNLWGGTTHFALKIDATPPAEFPVNIVPDSRITRRDPTIVFLTTDALSGINHYELKIIPLDIQNASSTSGIYNDGLFFEATSPYLSQLLNLGSYDVIVRAYDNAVNYREETQRLDIVTALFQFVSNQGVIVKGWFTIPWLWIWVILALLIAGLGMALWRLTKWHRTLDIKRAAKILPYHIDQQLSELKKYRNKYGKLTLWFLIFGLAAFLSAHQAFAVSVDLPPPLITTLSRNISNEEIFYIGGQTDASNIPVTIYFQNLQNGETLSETVTSDKKGEWFYRHDSFLPSGNYVLWAQDRLGDQTSPPSPQVQISVQSTAIQFGTSRLSLETVYLVLMIVLLIAVLILAAYVVSHGVKTRKKHKALMKEIKEAEESVRRGFAVLRRDIEAELSIVRKAKLTRELSEEEKLKEKEILKDLDAVQSYVGKEIWEVEQVESSS